jgi:2-polyprenyl-6-methoxyphenol hydroxylase-like FAD-dependent oxidoreductase
MPSASPSNSPDNRALVVGASMAGLFTARVLADHAERVTIVDHDELPDKPEPRRGAAQIHHSHVLLDEGIQVLEELFPGLTSELETFGAGISDAGADMRWFQGGLWKPQFRSGIRVFWCDRSKLEWAIRQRLLDRPNIEFVGNHKVVDFRASDSRITGIRVDTPAGDTETWPSELVVDATGRGTRTPQLLEDHGFDPPPVDQYDVDLGYVSCKVTHPDWYTGDWKTLSIFPTIPETTKMGVAYPVDDERFHVTLVGWCGDYPPTDPEGFQQFAADLPQPDVAELLGDTRRLTRLHQYRVPRAIWRRYDQMGTVPAGLVVVGDALCGFNPVYGQGMTVCAGEAAALQTLLEERPQRGITADRRFVESFYRKATSLIRTPWLISSSQDYRFPEVSGDRWLLQALGPVFEAVTDASGRSPRVHQRFLEVLTLQSHPLSFLFPGVAKEVAVAVGHRLADRMVGAGRPAYAG